MGETIIDLRETNIQEPGFLQVGVHSSQCAALADRGILSVGRTRITGRYHIVRVAPDFEHLTVCSEGAGSSFIRGRWTPFSQGAAVLAPRGAPHGARALPTTERGGAPWGLVWVTFAARPKGRPRLAVREATLLEGRWEPLAVLVEGLAREQMATRDRVAMYHWVELIHGLLERLLEGRGSDPRLARLWHRIQESLGAEWSLPAMAREAGLSEGHLRRLCRAELGVGPRDQLTRLRIQHATLLLSSTDATMDRIATAVGYSDAFAFSTAYRRVAGRSPREARRALRGHGVD
jgi:AraC-like DNA-binding protein